MPKGTTPRPRRGLTWMAAAPPISIQPLTLGRGRRASWAAAGRTAYRVGLYSAEPIATMAMHHNQGPPDSTNAASVARQNRDEAVSTQRFGNPLLRLPWNGASRMNGVMNRAVTMCQAEVR